jgi:hypothetical protein
MGHTKILNILNTFKKSLKSSIYPQSTIIIGIFGLSLASTGTFDIFLTIYIPSITCPNTTFFPSKCGQAFKVMKN